MTTPIKPTFRQVSLPMAFHNEVRAQAELSHRSMAGELEHAYRLAKAAETILTPEQMRVLIDIAKEQKTTAMTSESDAFDAIIKENPHRIALHPDIEGKYIRTFPGGSEVGTVDEAGKFTAD